MEKHNSIMKLIVVYVYAVSCQWNVLTMLQDSGLLGNACLDIWRELEEALASWELKWSV